MKPAPVAGEVPLARDASLESPAPQDHDFSGTDMQAAGVHVLSGYEFGWWETGWFREWERLARPDK